MAATPPAGADARGGRAQRDIGGGGKNSHTDLAPPAAPNLPLRGGPAWNQCLRPSALGCSRLVEGTVAASRPHPARAWLPRRAPPHLNAADRQSGQPAGAPGEIKRVGHGRAAPSGAEQNLLRRPVMKRVADCRQRVGVTNGCALKREADRVGQTADCGELPLGAWDAGGGGRPPSPGHGAGRARAGGTRHPTTPSGGRRRPGRPPRRPSSRLSLAGGRLFYRCLGSTSSTPPGRYLH
jgi:hypothetical protein